MMDFLGWSVIFADETAAGYRTDKGGDLWFVKGNRKIQTDYDNLGVNHISIKVEEQKDVDTFRNFLKERKIEALFDTPRHRPEFSAGQDQTYYQVMFRSPDNILFEVVYTGPKS